MATSNVNGTIYSDNVLNYSGILFNKSWQNELTPLFNMIPTTAAASRLFVMGADYQLGAASQPAITEQASMTAPEPKDAVTRENFSNVTQIFQRKVDISYVKMATSGEMAPNNAPLTADTAWMSLSGATNNVPNEFDFQVRNQLIGIKNDIEYTILNGVYQEPINKTTAAKTRGLIAGTTSNVVVAGGAELDLAMVRDVAQKLSEASPYGIASTVAICNPADFRAVGNLIIRTGGAGFPQHDMAGVTAQAPQHTVGTTVLMTEWGPVRFMAHRHCPQGTIMFANMGVCRNRITPTPGKGNFFYEELAKTGAGVQGQIFGMWGLDYGPEWYHAKITGLSDTTTDTEYKTINLAQPVGAGA